MMATGLPKYASTAVHGLSVADVARFRAYVAAPDENGCCEWLGPAGKRRYGVFGAQRRRFNAHRLSWELANDQAMHPDLQPHHTCENHWCVSPDHIQPLTRSDHRRVHGNGLGDDTEPHGDNGHHRRFADARARQVELRDRQKAEV